jgi:polypeptide N-acetylgalactosaminyltransferase
LKIFLQVSIIIPVHDEHLITLIRSVHSILNRTPAKLLEEIILVDDASGKGWNILPRD